MNITGPSFDQIYNKNPSIFPCLYRHKTQQGIKNRLITLARLVQTTRNKNTIRVHKWKTEYNYLFVKYLVYSSNMEPTLIIAGQVLKAHEQHCGSIYSAELSKKECLELVFDVTKMFIQKDPVFFNRVFYH